MTPELIRTIAVLSVAASGGDLRRQNATDSKSSELRRRGRCSGLSRFVAGGLPGTLTAAGAWLLGVALFFPFFALGGMGAGDVKLLAALAAWLGPIDAIYLAIFTSMAGGVIGLGRRLRARATRGRPSRTSG